MSIHNIFLSLLPILLTILMMGPNNTKSQKNQSKGTSAEPSKPPSTLEEYSTSGSLADAYTAAWTKLDSLTVTNAPLDSGEGSTGPLFSQLFTTIPLELRQEIMYYSKYASPFDSRIDGILFCLFSGPALVLACSRHASLSTRSGHLCRQIRSRMTSFGLFLFAILCL